MYKGFCLSWLKINIFSIQKLLAKIFLFLWPGNFPLVPLSSPGQLRIQSSWRNCYLGVKINWDRDRERVDEDVRVRQLSEIDHSSDVERTIKIGIWRRARAVASARRPRVSRRNTGGRLREVYPLRWKTNRRRRKRTLLGTSVADKLTKAILPRPSRPPHYRKSVDSGTIYTVKSPSRRVYGGKRERTTVKQRGRSRMKSFSIWMPSETRAFYYILARDGRLPNH